MVDLKEDIIASIKQEAFPIMSEVEMTSCLVEDFHSRIRGASYLIHGKNETLRSGFFRNFFLNFIGNTLLQVSEAEGNQSKIAEMEGFIKSLREWMTKVIEIEQKDEKKKAMKLKKKNKTVSH